jgi:hypothetical protein
MTLSYAQKLSEINERVHTLNPNLVTVGWFSSRCSKDACIPLSELRAVCLAKEHKDWLLMSLPAILHKGKVHIEGGWFESSGRGWINYSNTPVPACRATGVRKYLGAQDKQNKPSWYLNPDKEADQRMIDWAYEMTDEAGLEAQSDFNQFGEDFMSMPTFLAPMPVCRGFTMLRESEELERAVMHCARFGCWHIGDVHGLIAPSHGKAEYVDAKQVKFTHADCEGDPDAVEETFMSPEAAVRDRIYRVFGVQPMLELHPVPKEGATGLWMQPPQALFAPVKSGRHTLEELKQNVNYTAMKYMAALHSMEGPQGIRMMDYSLAYSSLMPWAHMDALPSRIRRVKAMQRALCSSGGDHRVNFFELGQTLLKTYRRLSKIARKDTTVVPNSEPEPAQPLCASVEAAGN